MLSVPVYGLLVTIGRLPAWDGVQVRPQSSLTATSETAWLPWRATLTTRWPSRITVDSPHIGSEGALGMTTKSHLVKSSP